MRYALASIRQAYRDFRNEGASRIEALAWTYCGIRNTAILYLILYLSRK